MTKRIIAFALAIVMSMSLFVVHSSAATNYIYGDINMDTKINSSDALLALQASTGMKWLKNYEDALADATGDGRVNSSDALAILQYSTGSVKAIKKTNANTLKVTKIDPVLDSGKFTYDLVFRDDSIIEGSDIKMTFVTDGKSKLISTKVFNDLFEVRLLYTGGKNYQVVPPLVAGSKGKYCEADDNISATFDTFLMFFTKDVVYGKTTTAKIDNKNYTCESYFNTAESEFKYYYYNGNLAKLVIKNGENMEEFNVNTVSNGFDASVLPIPADYEYGPNLDNPDAA